MLHERTVVQTAADAMFSTTARPCETAGAGTTASKSILRTMRKHSDPENLKIITVEIGFPENGNSFESLPPSQELFGPFFEICPFQCLMY